MPETDRHDVARFPHRLDAALKQIGRMRLAGAGFVLLLSLLVARSSWNLPILAQLERSFYDWRLFATSEVAVEQNKRVALVTYDEDTVLQTGKRSPLDRGLLARALPLIDAMKPRALAITIIFNQPQLEDQPLQSALRHMATPTYMGFVTSAADPRAMDREQEKYLRQFFRAASSRSLNPVDMGLHADVDGTIRQWPQKDPRLPQTLASALVASPATAGRPRTIRYLRPRNDLDSVFTEVPIQFVAAFPDAARPMIEGRYVLIGGALSPENDVVTPLSRNMPQSAKGIEVQAQMLVQALEHRYPLQVPSWALWLAALVVTALGGVTGLLDRYGWKVFIAIAAELSVVLGLPLSLEYFSVDTYGLPAVGWPAGWAMAFLAVGTAVRAIGSEQRRFAQSTLGKYLPTDIANEIIRDPERLTLAGEQREIFALFSDLEGFTELSHAITPRQLSSLLNDYLERMSEAVLRHGGTIDKFVGDAVVAFWGAPIARPDDGRRAVEAAIAMRQVGEEFRRLADPSLPRLGQTRIGLHRGEAIVGNFGGEGRIQYTALGDGMNTAARLESANKLLKTGVLVSGDALRYADAALFRPMGRIVLSGRATPVEVWEPAPWMDAHERSAMCEAWREFDSGVENSLRFFRSLAKTHPGDAALALLFSRLEQVGPGGAYVLGSK